MTKNKMESYSKFSKTKVRVFTTFYLWLYSLADNKLINKQGFFFVLMFIKDSF